jgi:cysteinyl-tRNA synthetase
MKLFNTLTNKKEEFVPISSPILIYSCGPTVYDFIHIGNARPICVFDTLRKYLEYIGYSVKFVQNFTDIDDKIIKKANEEGVNFLTITKRYINEYEIDAAGLNVKKADIHPRATKTIDEIIKIIDDLIKKNNAYVTKNGNVYFDTASFPEYGKLSRQNISGLLEGVRVENDSEKRSPLDFALWKTSKKGEPAWESLWGAGRPGWHIECSAMVNRHLGTTIDIHCGGQDLIFPHHENEIAQSECFNLCKFSNFWLHNSYINVDNDKMSKSLNNFFTVREISQKYGYAAVRFFLISSHYRSSLNFSEEVMKSCKNAVSRIENFYGNLIFVKNNQISENGIEIISDIDEYNRKFLNFMDDDMNTPGALSLVFDIVKKVNSKINSKDTYFLKESVLNLISFFEKLGSILGILRIFDSSFFVEKEIKMLIEKREIARKNKNWACADEIRRILEAKNVILEDTAQGVKIKPHE